MHKKIYCPAVLLLAVALTGCNRDGVKVYDVAKEQGHPSHGPHDGHDHSGHNHSVTLPAGWEAGPAGEMRVGSYIVRGENGKKAEVSIIPLPNRGGRELDNVNRWRSQVGLKGVTEEQLTKEAVTIEIERAPARFYEMAGPSVETDEPTRILGAIQDRGGTGWYFKIVGDDKLVAAQKPAFLKFLKEYHAPHGGPAPAGAQDPHAGLNMAAAAAGEPAAAPSGNWPAPASWKEQKPGMMQDAKFIAAGGKAIVTVSRAGGALAANIQRWQGQIGVSASTDAEAEKLATPIDVGGVASKIVDLAGASQRMVTVIVPKGEMSVFFKMMGDPAAVGAEKEAFIEFVRKVK
jgi:hypothetical protein